jgi:hypothetical protein
MQGYILNFNRVKDEDLIVTILSNDTVYTLYRFYGARHSHINIGYKIDFEIEVNVKSSIGRLKDVIQLGFPWLLDNKIMYHWQRYIKLFYPHLKDVDEIDSFYLELLDELAHKLNKQNPKRAILENYIKLLEYEGRLHLDFECLLCENEVKDSVSLVRSFLPTHSYCSYARGFKREKIENLFISKEGIDLNDEEIEYLWEILLQGI